MLMLNWQGLGPTKRLGRIFDSIIISLSLLPPRHRDERTPLLRVQVMLEEFSRECVEKIDCCDALVLTVLASVNSVGELRDTRCRRHNSRSIRREEMGTRKTDRLRRVHAILLCTKNAVPLSTFVRSRKMTHNNQYDGVCTSYQKQARTIQDIYMTHSRLSPCCSKCRS